MSSFFQELKRRNVFRVGVAYLAIAWLVLQVTDIVFENFGAPDWVMKWIMYVIAVGFPVAVFFAWAFELTPEGIKHERDVDRSQSITRHTGRRLNRAIIVVLSTAVVLLLVDKFYLQRDVNGAPMAEKSVAVLPFVALSNGPDDEYFADGLTEEILNSLARVPELLVIARTSAFHFKGQNKSIRQIADELGVSHIVEGSIRRDGERLRVTAQLIRATDGFQVWAEDYDRAFEDTFDVQTNIAERITETLGIVLDDALSERMRSVGTRNPEAFIAFQKGVDLYIKGHEFEIQTSYLRDANRYFDRALSLAPTLTIAYLMRADYYTHLLPSDHFPDGSLISDRDRQELFAAMKGDIESAVRLAPSEEQRISATFDLLLITGEWNALPGLLDSIADKSGCVGPVWINVIATPFGGVSEAEKVLRQALTCDPLNPLLQSFLGQTMSWGPDPKASASYLGKIMQTQPNVGVAAELVESLLAVGDFDQAESVLVTAGFGESQKKWMQFALASAQGYAKQAGALLEGFAPEEADRTLIFSGYARTGMREKANALAATLDAAPFGYIDLMMVPAYCKCGAPWDLEVTPNFAQMLDDAGFPWPPASPIDWPLKDW